MTNPGMPHSRTLQLVPFRGALFALTCFSLGLVGCGGAAVDSGHDAGTVAIEAPDALGRHLVGYDSFQAVDSARNDRTLRVDVWYPGESVGDPRRARYPLAPLIDVISDVALADLPLAAGSHPLLVFSHGYGGVNTQSVDLMEALASHGFIVAAPEHTGNSQSTLSGDPSMAAANRVPDVSFVIDTMLARGLDATDRFANGIDPARIGVTGHSFGGATALGTAAGWAGALPDPRVRAIVPISAPVDTTFTSSMLAGISIPILLLGGTEDRVIPVTENAVAFEQTTGAPVVYQVDILGATHTHFANICAIGNRLIELGFERDQWPSLGAAQLLVVYEETCGPDALPIAEASRLTNLYSVAFFRRYLRGETQYDRFLTEAHAATEPSVGFRVR